MHNLRRQSSKVVGLIIAFGCPIVPVEAASAAELQPATIERLVAVDDVCAWPNLTKLPNGEIVATIFNRPSHGSEAGDVDCYSSVDGSTWKLIGTPARHEPETNCMNVAAGLAKNGDLIVLSSGWSNMQQPGQPKKPPFRDAVLKVWVCRSSDGGRSWQVSREFPNAPEAGMTELIPFGDIVIADDGSLRASCYAADLPNRTYKTWMLRSDDDGANWSIMSLVSDMSNETFLLSLGKRQWLAAARHKETELFRSTDDGKTWTNEGPVTERNQINAHLLKLSDGRLLMTYGCRIADRHGVLAKFSSDAGQTWSEALRIASSNSGDCGYPSSVQRADGKIVTAFYSKSSPDHTRYHMGVAIWDSK